MLVKAGCEAVEHKLVRARPPVVVIRFRSAIQHIVAVPAAQYVGAVPAIQRVVAFLPE